MESRDPKLGRMHIDTRRCRWCHELLVPNRACAETAFTQKCEPEIPTAPAPPPDDDEPDTLTPCPKHADPTATLPCGVCGGLENHQSVPSTTSRSWHAQHPEKP